MPCPVARGRTRSRSRSNRMPPARPRNPKIATLLSVASGLIGLTKPSATAATMPMAAAGAGPSSAIATTWIVNRPRYEPGVRRPPSRPRRSSRAQSDDETERLPVRLAATSSRPRASRQACDHPICSRVAMGSARLGRPSCLAVVAECCIVTPPRAQRGHARDAAIRGAARRGSRPVRRSVPARPTSNTASIRGHCGHDFTIGQALLPVPLGRAESRWDGIRRGLDSRARRRRSPRLRRRARRGDQAHRRPGSARDVHQRGRGAGAHPGRFAGRCRARPSHAAPRRRRGAAGAGGGGDAVPGARPLVPCRRGAGARVPESRRSRLRRQGRRPR